MDALTKMLHDTTNACDSLSNHMDWAEDEIATAALRHPEATNRLHHGFILLTPTHQRMDLEAVYRAHCTELLNRVAADQDTRPATAAEICCACSDISQLAPLKSAAAGLYMRMWNAAGFPHHDIFDDRSPHYEILKGSQIDDLEHWSRYQLRQDDRRLDEISCSGRHHGEPVNCVYAATTPMRKPLRRSA